MKVLVIGVGETGQPLYEILSSVFPTERIDPQRGLDSKITECNLMNVCLPYSDDFVSVVEDYRERFKPELIVNHSTVPVGTTSKIKGAVHSPILGDHTNMKESLKKFTKWIGGSRAEEAEWIFAFAGIHIRIVPTSEETELLKLMCLAKYGMSIAFGRYQKSVFDKYGFDYSHVIEWDMNYNLGVKAWQQRPLIRTENGKIGGHCILPGTKILNDSFPNQILDEVIRYV